MNLSAETAGCLWTVHAEEHGVSCHLVDETTPLNRNSSWEEVLRSRIFRIDKQHICIGDYLKIEYKELTGIVKGMMLPNFPKILHEGGSSVVSRVVCLKYTWTRRNLQTNHCAFFILPTLVEAEMVIVGIGVLVTHGLVRVRQIEAQHRAASSHYIAPHLIGRAKELKKQFRQSVKPSKNDQRRPTELASGPAFQPQDSIILEKEELEGAKDDVNLLLGENSKLHLKWEKYESWSENELMLNTLKIGVPTNLRYQTWPKWLNLDDLADTPFEEECAEDAAHQIDLDINRTWPELLDENHRKDLREILRAYAAHNPATGYCQGMNMFVSMFIIMGFEKRQSFLMLAQIIERYLNKVHDPELTGLIRDVTVLEVLLGQHFPDTHQALTEAEIPILWIVSESFLTFLTKDWPLYRVLHFWDIIFSHGIRALYSIQLVLLNVFFPKIEEIKALIVRFKGNDPVKVLSKFRRGAKVGLRKKDIFNEVIKGVERLLSVLQDSHIHELQDEMKS